jgi:integrase
MANLGTKNGVFIARFRFNGKEYKRSLKTSNRKAAEGAMHRVEDVLHRLAVHSIAIPDGIDAGDFIVAGGTLTAPVSRAQPQIVPTLQEVIKEYADNLGHLAESNRYTVAVHLRNLVKKLSHRVCQAIDRVTYRDLEGFLQSRLKERSRTTVSKERLTIVQFFAWAVSQDYLSESPANDLSKVKTEGALSSTFRTMKEIEQIAARGGLTAAAEWALWDWLYLTTDEIAGLLILVRERATSHVSFLLHALPAYTGMRRGEILRLLWSDIAFDHDCLTARSRKQSRQESETQRRIDVHPELKTILLDWQKERPKGQYVISNDDCLTPLTPSEANSSFWEPLRGTSWCLCRSKNRFKIGFHTYRHSFASNLASAGVDQRVIDEFMGHQTEAMRKRYRHLFPKDRRAAIECFSLIKQSPIENLGRQKGATP